MTALQIPKGWQRLTDRTDGAYTPEHISVLRGDEIFVFGSNLLGHHIGGAARTARRVFNAEMGVAEGLTGQAYALSTLGEDVRQMAPEVLRASLGHLLRFTLEHPRLTFYLMEIGCGITGWPMETVRDLLWGAVRELSEEAYEQRAVLANLSIPRRFSQSVVMLSVSSEQYTRWCAETPSLPLYVQPWWLCAAAGRKDLLVFSTIGTKEGAPTLVWPLLMPTQRCLIVFPHCQSAGPLSNRPGAVGEDPFDRDRYITHLAAMKTLSEALPSSLHYIEAHLSLDYQDWLPCETPAGAWRSSVAYTHLLDLAQRPLQELHNSLIQRKVCRATALGLRELWAEETNVAICAEMPVELYRKSLQRSSGDRLCASSLRRLVTAAVAHQQSVVLLLLSSQTKEPVAGAFTAYRTGTAYYIAGGQDRTPEGEDAMVLLLDRLIVWSREAGCHTFDFEGSMQAGTAFFFRSFGAMPHPYLCLQAGRQTLPMRLQLRRYYLWYLY